MRKSVLIVAMAALALLGFSNSQAYAQTSTQNVTMTAPEQLRRERHGHHYRGW